MKNVVIFNAPPASGKDVAADYMFDYFTTGERLSFKDCLYEDVSYLFEVPLQDVVKVSSNRKTKELPNELFPKYRVVKGLECYIYFIYYLLSLMFDLKFFENKAYFSPREALIYTSEEVVKKKYGKSYYGERVVDKIYNSDDKWFFIADGGFKEEIYPLLEEGFNLIIVRIDREGKTFQNDSRTWLDENDFKQYDNVTFTTIDNNGSLDDLFNCVVDLSYDIVTNDVKIYYES